MKIQFEIYFPPSRQFSPPVSHFIPRFPFHPSYSSIFSFKSSGFFLLNLPKLPLFLGDFLFLPLFSAPFVPRFVGGPTFKTPNFNQSFRSKRQLVMPAHLHEVKYSETVNLRLFNIALLSPDTRHSQWDAPRLVKPPSGHFENRWLSKVLKVSSGSKAHPETASSTRHDVSKRSPDAQQNDSTLLNFCDPWIPCGNWGMKRVL